MKSQNEILPMISPKGGLKVTPSKDKFKYPAIADYNAFQIKNLNRYIRTNDVAQILKDAKTPIAAPQQQRDSEDILKDELKETSSNLVYLRKKYDEIKENCAKKEQEINKLRIEIDNYKSKEGFMHEDAHNAVANLGLLKDALNIQRIKIEEALENQRVYSHMLDRLKKDKLTDQIKSYNFETLLNVKSTTLNSETSSAKKAKQFEIMTKNVFEGVMKQLELEDNKRQKSLYVFEKTLNAQEEADQKRTERALRNKDVAESAFSDLKDSNETQWREVQLVHKFLNFFLKRKIEREIRQYETVEKAYQKIKASTGLSDTREIVSKFVNREQTYSELLISIADYEKKIADLRKINEQHKATIQGLKEQNQPSDKNKDDKAVSKSSLEEVYKDLETVSDGYKQTKLIMEKNYSWVMHSLIKLDKAKKVVNNKYYETYPKENFAGGFLHMLGVIKTNLEEIKDNDVEKVLDEIDKTKLDEEMRNEEFVAKNIRVKPIHLRAEKLATNESPLTSKRSLHLEENGPVETGGDVELSDDQDTIEAQRVSIKANALEEAIRAKKLQEKKEKEDNFNR